jgi:hypothetical protein
VRDQLRSRLRGNERRNARVSRGAVFDPDDIRILVSAFDKAWEAVLASGVIFDTKAQADTERETAAWPLAARAQQPERMRRIILRPIFIRSRPPRSKRIKPSTPRVSCQLLLHDCERLAISTATIPIRKMPSKVPAPPIEATGAPSPRMLPRLSRSAPIRVPRLPPI